MSVNLTVSPLGHYALKGIAGTHELTHVVPAEMAASMRQLSKKAPARKLQRGKATCIHGPDPAVKPEAFTIPLMDIFELPLVPQEEADPRKSLEARRPPASLVSVS